MTKAETIDPVNLVVSMLEKLLESQSCEEKEKKLTVRVYQFTTNLLYLPVYLFFHDVKVQMNGKVEFDYQDKGGDAEACKAVKNDSKDKSWPRNTQELILGVSELTEEFRGDGYFLNKVFINRLPLWGVALTNNPRINFFKMGSHIDFGSEEKRYDWITRLRFWKTFGGKLSLLRKEDLINQKARLSVSLYPRKTTARKLFDKFLDGAQMSYISEVEVDSEFNDLFDDHVDIALTVQPWKAVLEAERRGQQIEIVYVHQGQPDDISSVYMCEEDEAVRLIMDPLLEAINHGIQDKIQNIYRMTWVTNLSAYKYALQSTRHEGERNSLSMKPSMDEHLECALDMICDSRIYVYNMPNVTKTSDKLLLNKFIACYSDWLIASRLGPDFDYTYEISKIIDEYNPEINAELQLKRHPKKKTLEELFIKNESRLHLLKALANKFEYNCTTVTGNEFQQDWRCETLQPFFGGDWLDKCIPIRTDRPSTLWNDPGGMKGPWIYKPALEAALEQFTLQFTAAAPDRDGCKYLRCQKGTVTLQSSNDVHIWLLVVYKPNKNGLVFKWENENDRKNFKGSNFCVSEDLRKKLFTAYWLNPDSNEIQHIPNTNKQYVMPAILPNPTNGTKFSYGGINLDVGRAKNEYGLLLSFKISSTKLKP